MNILDEALTTSEAAIEWGKDDSTIRKALVSRRFRDGEYRKAGKDWLVTRSAMLRVFGVPVKSKKIATNGILTMVTGWLEHLSFKDHFPENLAYTTKVAFDVLFRTQYADSEKRHKIVLAPLPDYSKPYVVIVFARDVASPMNFPRETFSAIIANIKRYNIKPEDCEIYLDFGLKFESSRRDNEIYKWNYQINNDNLVDSFEHYKLEQLPVQIHTFIKECYAELKPNYGMNINYLDSYEDRLWLVKKVFEDVPEESREGLIKQAMNFDWNDGYCKLPPPDQR